MDPRFTFATGTGAADIDFASLAAAARHIVGMRAKAPAVQGLPPQLKATAGVLERSGLPGGRMVAVRAQDGSCAGYGALIGYLLMPTGRAESDARLVMDALIAAERDLQAAAIR